MPQMLPQGLNSVGRVILIYSIRNSINTDLHSNRNQLQRREKNYSAKNKQKEKRGKKIRELENLT